MNNLPADIQKDIAIINGISAVTTILDVVCRNTGMGFAAVARVTDTQWVACAVKDDIQFGLVPGGELELKTTICHEIHQNTKPVVIDHVAKDAVYACHHTPLQYGFQSYISVPIILKNGDFFGTLCAIDPNPANLTQSGTLEMFNLFADLLSYHIGEAEELAAAQANLTEERKTGELREQFIAVLGHDLRNPVNAISNSAEIMQDMQLEPSAQKFLTIIRNSVFRITGLIENVLDFARGRFGNGIAVNRTYKVPVENIINSGIAEIQVVYPHRQIEVTFYLSEPVYGDSGQIAQLFANLLSNAMTHGDSAMPVIVQAISNRKGFSLSVCNGGIPISPDIMKYIFQPFFRGENKQNKEGLGLGLYIASEIAQAHGGTLTVSSTEHDTCFQFQLPHAAAC